MKVVAFYAQDALGSEILSVLSRTKTRDLSLHTGKSHPLPRNADDITIVQENELFITDAVRKVKNLRIGF